MTRQDSESKAAGAGRKPGNNGPVTSVRKVPAKAKSKSAASEPVTSPPPVPVAASRDASPPRESPLPTPTKRRGVLHYLGLGASAGLLACVALVAAMAIVIPAVTGSIPMTILTGSMTPTYPPGTLIIVRPVDANTLTIGDPITYQIESGKPEVVTHRIIAVTSASDGTRNFTTQGDANSAADENPVIPAQVRGKVWYSIPYIGWVNNVVNGEMRSWLIPIIAIALFGYAGYQAASAIAGNLKKRRESASDTESDAVTKGGEANKNYRVEADKST